MRKETSERMSLLNISAGIFRCFFVGFPGVMHFEMDEEGQKCPEEDDGTQYQQFFEVPDQDGFQNLCRHLEFQTQGKTVCQLEFDIAGNPLHQAFGILPEGGTGRNGNDGYAHQLAEGNENLQKNFNKMFQHGVFPFYGGFVKVLPNYTEKGIKGL